MPLISLHFLPSAGGDGPGGGYYLLVASIFIFIYDLIVSSARIEERLDFFSCHCR
jgi:hypothetical protein